MSVWRECERRGGKSESGREVQRAADEERGKERMLHKRFDLLATHPTLIHPDLLQHFPQDLIDELEILLRFRFVEGLKTDVARGVGFHVGQSAGEGEEVRRVGGVLGEEVDGMEEEPEVGGL
jgi:hypothetical protein